MKQILPNDAINKAYDEVLEKESNKKLISLEEWRSKIYKEDDCPICSDEIESKEGCCSCHIVSPCGYCCHECNHTNGEVENYSKE